MTNIKYLFYFITLLLLTSCSSVLNKRIDIIEMDKMWRNGNFTEARIAVQKYLEKNPDNELAWTLLGHIESDDDKDASAITAYKKALQLNPKTAEALTGMGIISRKEGDYEKASDYYYQAIRIDPNYAEAYSSLVVINLKRKKFEEAVKVGLKGYELNKEDGIIAANLAAAYHFINDTIRREKYFTIAENNGYKNIVTLRALFEKKVQFFD